MVQVRNSFLITVLLCGISINADTLFVESLDDTLGTTATLRQTIIDASGEDVIQFNVSGTIFLDETLGELVVDKKLTIDGQNKIIVDGQDQINICFHITNVGTADASNSIIQNITIQNFNGHEVGPGSGTALQELPAYGILIDNSAIDCSVINTSIKSINSGLNQEVAGIKSTEEAGTLTSNTIEFISSEDNPGGNSGKAYGIFIDNTVLGDCSNNVVHTVSSGNASGSTGGFRGIIGISIDMLSGNCLDNAVYNIRSGNAGTSSGDVLGISFGGSGTNDIDCLRNTVYNLSTGAGSSSSGLIFGLSFNTTISNCSYNTVYNLFTESANNTGQATGIIGVPVTGDCSYNTVYNIQSATATNNSGTLFGITFSGTIDGNFSNNILYNIISGDAGNNSGLVFGVRLRIVNLEFSNNSICNISSGDAGNDSGRVFGMDATSVGENFCKNIVCFVSSGLAGNISGNVTGIETSTINGNCFNNTVKNLLTGDAPTATNIKLLGIFFRTLNADFFNNVITDLSITSASSIDQAGGILFSFVADNTLIACNTISRVTGDQDGSIFGMQIEEGNTLTVRNNTIDSVGNPADLAHGLILGNDGDEGEVVSNSLVSFNTISNATGNSANGFGVTILGEQSPSTGNDLLNNSIFNINGKAINIINNGVPVDGSVTLQSAICGTNKIIIRGVVTPEPGFENSDFVVQFFASKNNIPPQTMMFLGEEIVSATGSGAELEIPFLVEVRGCFPQAKKQFITATATAQPTGTTANNNTSEVSNAILGCNTNSVCAFACTSVPEPSVCPLLS